MTLKGLLTTSSIGYPSDSWASCFTTQRDISDGGPSANRRETLTDD